MSRYLHTLNCILQGRKHQGGETMHHPTPPHPPPPPHLTFLRRKRKKGKPRKNERFSKQKLLKGCHQGQYVTVLAIIECLELKNFS